MKHSVTYNGVYEKHRPGNVRKAGVAKHTAILITELPQKVIQVYKKCTGGDIKMTGEHLSPKKPATTHQVYSIMILPQVHLRKPCYDFYFL